MWLFRETQIGIVTDLGIWIWAAIFNAAEAGLAEGRLCQTKLAPRPAIKLLAINTRRVILAFPLGIKYKNTKASAAMRNCNLVNEDNIRVICAKHPDRSADLQRHLESIT